MGEPIIVVIADNLHETELENRYEARKLCCSTSLTARLLLNGKHAHRSGT